MAAQATLGVAGVLVLIGITLVSLNAVTEDTYIATIAISVNLPVTVSVESAVLTVTDDAGTVVASGVLLGTPIEVHQGTNYLNMSLTRYISVGDLYRYRPSEVFTVHPTVLAKWGPVTMTFDNPVTVTVDEVRNALEGL